MIKELSKRFKDLIVFANLPFVEIAGGIVIPITYTENGFNEGEVFKYIIPVSWDNNAPKCDPSDTPAKDFVPDSDKRGILYFEESTCISQGNSPYGTKYSAEIRLVAWYNKAKITSDVNAHVQTAYITMLNNVLNIGVKPFNLNPFTRVSINTTRILSQDAGIFSKYTYKEEEKQYLMPPYESLAMDLQVNFSVPPNCILPNTSLATECTTFNA